MAINPSKLDNALENPTERANQLNDPQFENQQGYYPYDLTHQEFITARYGEVIPTMHLDTVPGDRTVVQDNVKILHQQINGNFLSTVNQYVDSFFIPLRSLFPTNYEKLIPNPNKGSDLPNSALPQFPISMFVDEYLLGQQTYTVIDRYAEEYQIRLADAVHFIDVNEPGAADIRSFYFGRFSLLATVLSRGQLLDFLGLAFDSNSVNLVGLPHVSSKLQYLIDQYFLRLYDVLKTTSWIGGCELSLSSNKIDFESAFDDSSVRFDLSSLSGFRAALSDIFEAGQFPIFDFNDVNLDDESYVAFLNIHEGLRQEILKIFNSSYDVDDYINYINRESNPFQQHHINLAKPLAYQQSIAEYYSNDSIDNIFTAELYMQLLRSVMFPPDANGFSKEPTFVYNGVTTEYDYISAGGLYYSLFYHPGMQRGHYNRQYVFMTLMFLLRRSLRYGDYFATARKDLLAVNSNLKISVDGGSVSPIDVTRNLLMQRYLNASNYVGSGFLQYFASMYGVKPSDTGTRPRFISHKKIELQNQITNNTSDNQGWQTTNLVAHDSNLGFDVFIDDFGVILSLSSFDVLPVYKSGIDSSYHFADRFDYFNSMLQNIGDQPIYLSELMGRPLFSSTIFGYTMRNAEYKYKLSKAHGAFVNSLPGFLMSFPYFAYNFSESMHIDSDFIRDKPKYMDPVCSELPGASPASYYHFVISCTNVVQCARKIQATPPLLF